MDYGKYKYEQTKREKETKKNQKVIETKEIRVSSNIAEHDFMFKCKNAKSFLESGHKVKFSIRFRGRELNNTKIGENMLNKFIEELSDISVVDKKPTLDGKTMITILSKK